MVNYRGPYKQFTGAEKNYLISHPHSYGVEPNGDLIIEELPPIIQQPVPTDLKTIIKSKKDQELEQNKKEWDKYFVDSRGKIPNIIPKTIFDAEKDDDKT